MTSEQESASAKTIFLLRDQFLLLAISPELPGPSCLASDLTSISEKLQGIAWAHPELPVLGTHLSLSGHALFHGLPLLWEEATRGPSKQSDHATLLETWESPAVRMQPAAQGGPGFASKLCHRQAMVIYLTGKVIGVASMFQTVPGDSAENKPAGQTVLFRDVASG